jgi:hypothetical protein
VSERWIHAARVIVQAILSLILTNVITLVWDRVHDPDRLDFSWQLAVGIFCLAVIAWIWPIPKPPSTMKGNEWHIDSA